MSDNKQNVNDDILLEVRNLKKYFPIKTALGTQKGAVKAVDDVSFSIKKGIRHISPIPYCFSLEHPNDVPISHSENRCIRLRHDNSDSWAYHRDTRLRREQIKCRVSHFVKEQDIPLYPTAYSFWQALETS